jgi:hypothetical protein
MTVELACLNRSFLLSSQIFCLLETLCHQAILFFASSLNSLLTLDAVLVSLLLQSDVLTVRRLESSRLPCFVLRLCFACSHFALNFWFTLPLPQFLHYHIAFILQLLYLFCFLPSLKNLLHVSVFFVLKIVNSIFYFLLIESGLFKCELGSLSCWLKIMLYKSLSIPLGTRLRVIWFVGLERFGGLCWPDWSAWPCWSATFIGLNIVI